MKAKKLNHSLVIKALGKDRVKKNELLSKHTYFKIGGPADLFFTAYSASELEKAVITAIKTKTFSLWKMKS